MIPYKISSPFTVPFSPYVNPKSEGWRARCSDMGRTTPTSICEELHAPGLTIIVLLTLDSFGLFVTDKVWANSLFLPSKVSFLSSSPLFVLLCPFFFCPSFPPSLLSFLPSCLPAFLPSFLSSFLPPFLLSHSAFALCIQWTACSEMVKESMFLFKDGG